MAKSNKNKAVVRKTSSMKPRSVAAICVIAVAVLGGGGMLIYDTLRGNDRAFEPSDSITMSEYELATRNLSGLRVRANDAKPPHDYDSRTTPGWNDADRNGCSTREDELISHMHLRETHEDDTCKVISGKLFDYYIGEEIVFHNNTPGGGIDIDHIVAKGDAWDSGGYLWSESKWSVFTNDPDELIAVSASINRQKGDKNASKWLPPNELFQCKYVAHQVMIKYEYELSVTESEKATMGSVLNNQCIIAD